MITGAATIVLSVGTLTVDRCEDRWLTLPACRTRRIRDRVNWVCFGVFVLWCRSKAARCSPMGRVRSCWTRSCSELFGGIVLLVLVGCYGFAKR